MRKVNRNDNAPKAIFDASPNRCPGTHPATALLSKISGPPAVDICPKKKGTFFECVSNTHYLYKKRFTIIR